MIISKFLYLQKFHFTFDANKFELFCWSIPVIEEQLFARLNSPFCKYTDSMVTIYHHHLSVAIRIDGMIGKADFVTFSCGIDDKVIVQIEQKTAHVFIVDLTTTIGFLL